MNPTLTPTILFGSTKPWLPPPWLTTDDRLRNGSSQSHLSALPHNGARFHGHLDTSTLGGAGFAAQFSPLWPSSVGGIDAEDGDGDGDGDAEDGQGESWDLSGYDGIEVEVGRGDGKVYTFILKDGEMGGKGEDGRGGAGVSWEVEVVVGGDEGGVGGKEDGGIGDDEKEGGGSKIWIPWGEFKATYRGKPKKDAGELKTGEIRQVGLMMRSYFGKQEGDFSVVLKSLSARKTVKGDEQRKAVGRLQGSMTDAAIQQSVKGRGTGF